ncbi:MAG: methylated-DNA--[protein]-cysteine S-methyltransferase [Flavobacteriales bacterium]|nr:methylated-DNA--[protein]-cysteine S-methyltransferase [Flavobacteriales bacterium]MCB9197222.1 methylated-DNA--[protein]-cysteine S-methyltransferase [Flavobacteriales bacterium]
MNQIDISYYNSPYGELILGAIGDNICLCDWRYRNARTTIDRKIKHMLHGEFIESRSRAITDLTEQLDGYFYNKRQQFDVTYVLCGTGFQHMVWNALIDIPYGRTISYQKLTEKLGDPKAIRAVASANGANALSLILPCHRVIGTDGSLTGYAGGIQAKQSLLSLESQTFQTSLFD